MNYDELTGITGELEFNTDLLENIAANAKNAKANRYIRNAIIELKLNTARALALRYLRRYSPRLSGLREIQRRKPYE